MPLNGFIKTMNDWLERNRVLILAAVGLALAGAVAIFALRWRTPAPIVIEPAAPSPTPGPMQIYVSGAVARPAVYDLPAGALAQDALRAAGGPLPEADLNVINLARPLQHGDQVYVPLVGELPPPLPDGSQPVENESGGLVNINTADQAELESLPGIGPATAQAIIEYRQLYGPFPDAQAIQEVPGIGPATFAEIAPFIVVE